jgi:hypothetical protein
MNNFNISNLINNKINSNANNNLLKNNDNRPKTMMVNQEDSSKSQ